MSETGGGEGVMEAPGFPTGSVKGRKGKGEVRVVVRVRKMMMMRRR